ncbi:hypothetical protein DIS24_g2201 [Lasiodiplodia hormozganensis]|uniref:Carcinoembryonic antigen-related cell adhesion molecule 1 n=1 Tax=Lasiodiplodia hormozganensis TaxID=869390 RepID=A0AA39Z066_9PEZI|nr:hypothetical protein DIS24_g2201 [Lasiodiplodia hormozganensis]
MGNIETSQIFNCVSAFPSSDTFTVSSYWFVSPFDSGTTTISVSAGETVRAYGPIVRRASDDPSWTNVLPTSTTTVSPGSSANAGTAAATAGGSNSGGGSSDSGLSTGAKAGIGVGVGVGVLLIVAACVGGFMIGKRASRKGAEAEAEKRRLGGELASAPVQELSAAQTRHELQPAYISELEGTQRK